MTASEKLITRRIEQDIEEGYDSATALIRTANYFGIDKRRVLQVWVTHRTAKYRVPKAQMV